MADLRIAIIIGSTRPGRNSAGVAQWVLDQAKDRSGADYELVDLADYPLPHFEEPISPAYAPSSNAEVVQWAEKVSQYDGYVFVTPEYNHSISAVLKNALDYVYEPWNNKAAAFVSYGSLGGARAVEHLRGITSELQIAHVRTQLGFSLFTDFEDFRSFTPGPQHLDGASNLFDQLESWTRAMKSVRAEQLQGA